MMDYTHSNSHPYSASCGYCHHGPLAHYTFGEDSIVATTNSILDENYFTQEEPFRYNYLLNLMTAPDMGAYLSAASFTDDVYALPLHLQRLISEAKEEIVLNYTKQKERLATTESPALRRLEHVRTYIWMRSDGDFANLMSAINELVTDEDELADLLRV
jgi:hypothetical protein